MQNRTADTVVVSSRRRAMYQPEKDAAVTMPPDARFDSQDELQDYWLSRLESTPQDEWVPVCGNDGLYTEIAATELGAIAEPDNCYLVSEGLGCVPITANAPLYCLAQNFLRAHVRDDRYSYRDWWSFVANQYVSIADLAEAAIRRETCCVICLDRVWTWRVGYDLARIARIRRETLRQHVRVFGSHVESTLPVELLEVYMPTDHQRLHKIVPGTRYNTMIRYAALWAYMRSEGLADDDPAQDVQTIERLYGEGRPLDIDYDFTNRARARTPHERLNQMSRALRDNYVDRAAGRPDIARQMMIRDGWDVPISRFRAAWDMACCN